MNKRHHKDPIELHLRRFVQASIKRARKYGVESRIYSCSAVEARMLELGWVCVYCGGPFEQVDHVIALVDGGTNTLDNIAPSCTSCNLRKGHEHHQGTAGRGYRQRRGTQVGEAA